MATDPDKTLRMKLGSWTSTWFQFKAMTMDIWPAFGGNTGHGHQYRPGCSRTMESVMTFCNSMDPDITVALGGSTGHSDHYGPSGSIAYEHQHGFRLEHRPRILEWPWW
ncbi:hypothetical protein STEG23_018341 [Scotinomys teguina]